MAVKALSPGVNDPTTAVLCVDRLAEILLHAGRRQPDPRVRHAPEGPGCLILPRTEFDTLVDTALTEIRHYGTGNPRFAADFLRRLGDLGRLLPDHRRPAVARHAAATLRTARRVVDEPSDLHRVERAAERALQDLGVTEAA